MRRETDGTERGEKRVLSCCVSNQLFPEGLLGDESRKQPGGPRSAGYKLTYSCLIIQV